MINPHRDRVTDLARKLFTDSARPAADGVTDDTEPFSVLLDPDAAWNALTKAERNTWRLAAENKIRAEET